MTRAFARLHVRLFPHLRCIAFLTTVHCVDRRASLEPKTGLAAWLDLTKIACFVLHVGVVVIYLFLSFYPFKTLNDIADPNGIETDVKFLDKTWEGGDLSTSTSKRAALAGVTGHLIGLVSD